MRLQCSDFQVFLHEMLSLSGHIFMLKYICFLMKKATPIRGYLLNFTIVLLNWGLLGRGGAKKRLRAK